MNAAGRLRGSRLDIAIYVAVLLFGLMYLGLIQPIEDIAPDSSAYQGLAHNLRELGRYEFNFVPHTQYPPGLPLLLAAISSVFGDQHVVYLRAMAVFGMLALLVTYEFLKRAESRAAAISATLLLAASGYFFLFVTGVLNSDVPYLVVSVVALLIGGYLESREEGQSWVAAWIAFTLLLAYAAILRSASVALVLGYGGWVVLSFFRTPRRSVQLGRFAVAVLLAAAALAAWFLYVDSVKPASRLGWGDAYSGQFRLLDPHRPELGYASVIDILARIPVNALQHSAHLSELTFGVRWIDQIWYSPFVVLPLVLIAVGCTITMRRRVGPVELYFLSYAGVLALWPYDVGARFVLPVYPIAFLYAWRAGTSLCNVEPATLARLAKGGVAAALVLCIAAAASQLLFAWGSSLQARLAPWLWFGAAIVSAGVYVKARTRITEAGRQRERAPILVRSAGVLVLGFCMTRGVLADVHAAWTSTGNAATIPHQASVDAARWIKAHAARDDAVMAQQLAVVHYVSGHRIIPFPATSDGAKLVAAIRQGDPQWLIVVTSATGGNIRPTESERLAALQRFDATVVQLVETGKGFQVYRVGTP